MGITKFRISDSVTNIPSNPYIIMYTMSRGIAIFESVSSLFTNSIIN